LLWPGTFAFADWLLQHRYLIERRRCLEIGSGTGALAIFLKKEFNLDITTSDYNDQEIEDNIVHNCIANKIIPSLPHIKHTWGDEFPISEPDWDLIIASDILLYVKQYPNLIKSLTFLLKKYKPTNVVSPAEDTELPRPVFLMSWRRRIGKDDESLFFTGCEEAGLEVKHLGNRVYCIKLRESNL
jgi:predicted nicotinamide N-methyase